jgi:hypothetical protein
MKPLLLAEISGPYGPVSIAERVLQKIWWRGDFQQGGLRTLSGKPLRRVKAGRWNHAEGPDFIGAVLDIDGKIVQGDVEVHFYAEDWKSHGHNADPAFNNVVLHLLLFPPRFAAAQQSTCSGRTPETLVLLPCLQEDLEDYANREALVSLEAREKSGWHETLLAQDEGVRLRLLREKAETRWQQKIRFAKQRLETHGWDEACHQLALETLGLKRNRAPMSALALRHPLREMNGANANSLFAEQRSLWRLAGMRPANHPLRRLRQYLDVLKTNPAWPSRLREWGVALSEEAPLSPDSSAGHDTARFRKTHRLSATTKRLENELFSTAIGGTRLHTLAVDALLPLLAADGVAVEMCARHWYHWQLGDVPAKLVAGLREELPPEDEKIPVMCNGLFQGLLQLSHEHG